MTHQMFDQILEQVQRNNAELKRMFSVKDIEHSMGNYIDIDRFIEVLYSLLKDNNYILSDGDKFEPGKFYFTEAYPDTATIDKHSAVVVFEIIKRAPASLSANADPFQGTKHYRPIYIGSERDGDEGGRVINLGNFYDNMIQFTCYSSKSDHARKMATELEGIFSKYYFILKQRVMNLVYIGRQMTKQTNYQADSKYRGIPMQIFVRTCEHTMIREQEINDIEVFLTNH